MKGKINPSLEELLDDLLETAKSNISEVDSSKLPKGENKSRKYNEATRDIFNQLKKSVNKAVSTLK